MGSGFCLGCACTAAFIGFVNNFAESGVPELIIGIAALLALMVIVVRQS